MIVYAPPFPPPPPHTGSATALSDTQNTSVKVLHNMYVYVAAIMNDSVFTSVMSSDELILFEVNKGFHACIQYFYFSFLGMAVARGILLLSKRYYAFQHVYVIPIVSNKSFKDN